MVGYSKDYPCYRIHIYDNLYRNNNNVEDEQKDV